MLEAFIVTNRDTIIDRARERVASRHTHEPDQLERDRGIPDFVAQLVVALAAARVDGVSDHDALAERAREHGGMLLRTGLTIAQVVHEYGDICQTITELASEMHEAISPADFQAFNLCLDDAIAGAVSEYSRQRERSIGKLETQRLGVLAHELRNFLNTAVLAFDSIKESRVPVGGSTSLVLARSLMGMRDLLDRSLADVTLDAGVEYREVISVQDFVEEVEIAAMLEARARALRFVVVSVGPTVEIFGDRRVLGAALSNLLRNAFKFSPKQGFVSLTTRATENRVRFEIADDCGGLPPGKAEALFLPFRQGNTAVTGVGLGLAVCMKAALAHDGDIHVRDIPGKGCIFTLDLPRHVPALA